MLTLRSPPADAVIQEMKSRREVVVTETIEAPARDVVGYRPNRSEAFVTMTLLGSTSLVDIGHYRWPQAGTGM